MVLGMSGTGKYLSKRFNELRDMAYEDESLLSDDEKAFAETSSMTVKNQNVVGMFEIEAQPDPWYDSMPGKLLDVRRLNDRTLPEEKNKN
jgi:hypothetical protein